MPRTRFEDAALVTSVDTRLLSSLIQLTEAVDASAGIDWLARSTAQWARNHLRALDAEFVRAREPRSVVGLGEAGVETWSEVNATALSVPTSSRALCRVVFKFPEGELLSEELRRVLLVAGRIIGSGVEGARAFERARRDREESLGAGATGPHGFLGASPAAKQVADMIPRLAASDVLVLLQGETGTGKSYLARLIHEYAPSRRSETFCAINCAAIPDALFESELFGHEKGAFTGAVSSEKGKFEAAGVGTVLLDEIGELSLANQAKLLRAIEERCFERVGSHRPVQLKARVLVATHRDLREMVRSGSFREDLYYRVRNVVVRVPALRERTGDIPHIAERILRERATAAARRIDGFAASALEAIERYAWPGNVRELRAAIDRAIALGSSDRVEIEDLPAEVLEGAHVPPPHPDGDLIRLPQTLETIEQIAITHALQCTGNNKARAAALLGLKTSALYYRLRQQPPHLVSSVEREVERGNRTSKVH